MDFESESSSLSPLPLALGGHCPPPSGVPPRPKWWLLHFTNYLVMCVFVASVVVHLRGDTHRDASVLPMLLVWSGCMAYFFGFFGISFVDKDEDLFQEGLPLERNLYTISEEGGDDEAASGKKKTTTTTTTNRRRKDPVEEDDDDTTTKGKPFVRLRVDGRDLWVPLKSGSLASFVSRAGAKMLTVSTRSLGGKKKNHHNFRASACVSAVDVGTALEAVRGCFFSLQDDDDDAFDASSASARSHQQQVGVLLRGRCAYVERSGATRAEARHKAAALAETIVARVGRKKAKVSCVVVRGDCGGGGRGSGDGDDPYDDERRTNPKRKILVAEATVPGPIVQKTLKVSVSDLCHAKSRIDAANDIYAFADFFARHARDAVENFATAVHMNLLSPFDTFRFVAEPVNGGRDLHVDASLELTDFPYLLSQHTRGEHAVVTTTSAEPGGVCGGGGGGQKKNRKNEHTTTTTGEGTHNNNNVVDDDDDAVANLDRVGLALALAAALAHLADASGSPPAQNNNNNSREEPPPTDHHPPR